MDKLGSVKIELTPAKTRLEKFPEGLRSDVVEETLKDPKFTLVEDSEERLVHTFTFDGNSGRRIKFKNISRHWDNPFAHTGRDVSQGENLERSSSASQQAASPIYHSNDAWRQGLPNNRQGKCDQKNLRVIRVRAQDLLNEKRHERASLEVKMEDQSWS